MHLRLRLLRCSVRVATHVTQLVANTPRLPFTHRTHACWFPHTAPHTRHAHCSTTRQVYPVRHTLRLPATLPAVATTAPVTFTGCYGSVPLRLDAHCCVPLVRVAFMPACRYRFTVYALPPATAHGFATQLGSFCHFHCTLVGSARYGCCRAVPHLYTTGSAILRSADVTTFTAPVTPHACGSGLVTFTTRCGYVGLLPYWLVWFVGS